MESESKAKLPNWFLNSQRQKVGDMSILWKEKKYEKGILLLAFFQHSGYYLGRAPLQQYHTQPVEIGTWGPGARAAAERATQGLSFGGLWALRPQTNTGNPAQTWAGSVVLIDFSCILIAPEVLLASRDLLHPSQPTHYPLAWALLALLDPWIEVQATGEEAEDESPWQWWWAVLGRWVQSSTSLYSAFQPPTLVSIWKKENGKCFSKSHLWHSPSLCSMQMQM